MRRRDDLYVVLSDEQVAVLRRTVPRHCLRPAPSPWRRALPWIAAGLAVALVGAAGLVAWHFHLDPFPPSIPFTME